MNYEIDSNTLVVSGNLDGFMDMAFEANLIELLESESDVLNIDMLMVDSIVISQYVGQLVAFATAAKEKEKIVRIIASAKVAKILEMAGIDALVELIKNEE